METLYSLRRRPIFNAIRNALSAAGVKIVGRIREASNAMLLSLQGDKGSVAYLRQTLGPSTDGIRSKGPVSRLYRAFRRWSGRLSYPDKQTFSVSVGMSQTCQQETRA